MTPITIYHNPKCGTSRNALRLLKELGYEPNVVLYLETPPSVAELTSLLQVMGSSAQDLLRKNVEPFEKLPALETLTEAELIEHMVAQPLLINRPIVVGELGAKLCRPCELVLDVVAKQLQVPFVKDNGEVITPSC